jgi:hypothetical protein
MANSFPSESDRIAASAVYDFGAAVARFRYDAEVNYIRGGDNNDFDAPPPESIATSFRAVAVTAQRVADAVPSAKTDADAVIAVAQEYRDLFRRVWLNGEHLSRWEDAAVDGLTRTNSINWKILSGSPFDPLAWADYQAAANRLQKNLPGALASVLSLSRLLTDVRFPLPSDYDAERDEIPAENDDDVVLDVGPQVADLLLRIQQVSGLLGGVDRWLGVSGWQRDGDERNRDWPRAGSGGLHGGWWGLWRGRREGSR